MSAWYLVFGWIFIIMAMLWCYVSPLLLEIWRSWHRDVITRSDVTSSVAKATETPPPSYEEAVQLPPYYSVESD